MSVFFIVVIFFYAWIGKKSPVFAKWMPVGMLILGVPTFLVASIIFGRYRQVFDYEKASFWGRQMFAKQIRDILSTISLAGGWLTFGGLVLFVISL